MCKHFESVHNMNRWSGMRCLFSLLTAALLAHVPVVGAQERIYRCGNEYTNNPTDAQARGCRVVEGGNITIVQGLRPAAAAQAKPAAENERPGRATPAPASGARNDSEKVDAAAQQARDNDARAILEAELRRAEGRLAEARAQYNNGEPEKRGPEFRNHQIYLTRVAELKAVVARAENDVAGIRREIGRLNPAPAAAAAPR